jgi:hypothetical protein
MARARPLLRLSQAGHWQVHQRPLGFRRRSGLGFCVRYLAERGSLTRSGPGPGFRRDPASGHRTESARRPLRVIDSEADDRRAFKLSTQVARGGCDILVITSRCHSGCSSLLREDGPSASGLPVLPTGTEPPTSISATGSLSAIRPLVLPVFSSFGKSAGVSKCSRFKPENRQAYPNVAGLNRLHLDTPADFPKKKPVVPKV